MSRVGTSVPDTNVVVSSSNPHGGEALDNIDWGRDDTLTATGVYNVIHRNVTLAVSMTVEENNIATSLYTSSSSLNRITKVYMRTHT